ncbi:MAG: helix-turn-helix domain-containing protein [Acidimicrobiales bacterium]|nr:helix-turn-helix domain-containing protein [Acidimicrobiales bacterium]
MAGVMNQLMTIQDLSEYLRVPVATIYYWRHRGEGPPALKVQRALRYRREDVDAWITETNQDA